MQNDLISRSKIRNYIKSLINPYGKPFEGTAYELGLKIMKYIDNMSCAYDIENVLKQLEDCDDCPNCSMYCADANICGFDEMRKRAINIVRDGMEE